MRLVWCVSLMLLVLCSACPGPSSQEGGNEPAGAEPQGERVVEQVTGEPGQGESQVPDAAMERAAEPAVEPAKEVAQDAAVPEEPALVPEEAAATPEEAQSTEGSTGMEGSAPEGSGGDGGGSGKTCTFNSDCPTTERCECSEVAGCFCRTGARGTGKNGVDPCKNGQDCETALCVEGSDGLFYCSGACQTDSDCAQKLPICSNISFLGRVCIRKPN